MPEEQPKRARGSYSKLICLQCRKRKIRCILPEDGTIEPSDAPQTPENACQRCRQHGLECIIDRTVLGRPSQKRSIRDEFDENYEHSVLELQHRPANHAAEYPQTTHADVEPSLMSNPNENNEQPSKLSKADLYESFLGPLHLLSALLTRDKTFGSDIVKQITAPRASFDAVFNLIDPEVCLEIDKRLTWHRTYFPYVRPIGDLREALLVDSSSTRASSTKLLFALLASLAVDIPPGIPQLRRIQPSLARLVQSLGQIVLFTLPKNRHTAVALELIANYRPTALVTDPSAAGHSIRAEIYAGLAKRAALQIRMNTAVVRLDNSLQDPNAHISEEDVLDSVQWCSLLRGELDLDWHSQSGEGRSFRSDPVLVSTHLEESIVVLKKALKANLIPPKAWYATIRLTQFSDKNRTIQQLKDNWRDLAALSSVIVAHERSCKPNMQEIEAQLGTVFAGEDQSQNSYALGRLANMSLHIHSLQVAGHGMFYGLMSTYHPSTSQTVELEKAARTSDYVIERLTSHREDDPDRPEIRKFLEKFGMARVDALENVLSMWITLVDEVSLGGVPYQAPTRNLCADVLFICKDVVEHNAARLKGWGKLHERVETQLILFNECARRLESLEIEATHKDAQARGSIPAATAKLIRALHRIVATWKKSTAQNKKRRQHMEGGPGTAMPVADPATATNAPENYLSLAPVPDPELFEVGLDEFLTNDIFASWENWPSFDPAEMSGLFGE